MDWFERIGYGMLMFCCVGLCLMVALMVYVSFASVFFGGP